MLSHLVVKAAEADQVLGAVLSTLRAIHDVVQFQVSA
jgi:hypothetical protein